MYPFTGCVRREPGVGAGGGISQQTLLKKTYQTKVVSVDYNPCFRCFSIAVKITTLKDST
jgi:methyl coenzyme M reductase subunit C